MWLQHAPHYFVHVHSPLSLVLILVDIITSHISKATTNSHTVEGGSDFHHECRPTSLKRGISWRKLGWSRHHVKHVLLVYPNPRSHFESLVYIPNLQVEKSIPAPILWKDFVPQISKFDTRASPQESFASLFGLSKYLLPELFSVHLKSLVSRNG
jgi:hypothetical protein